jgi:hypothetical protein
MSMFDLNCKQSIRDAIDATKKELDGMDNNIWPHYSMVPIDKRDSYRETMLAQLNYLNKRLAWYGDTRASVERAIKITKTVLDMIDENIWPSEKSLPIDKREDYKNKMLTQLNNLNGRLAVTLITGS